MQKILILDLPLINCEIELDLTWSEDYVISGKLRIPAEGDNPAISTTN